MYSFEPGLEGFVFNGGGVTVSLSTDSQFASEGSNSMKLEYTSFSSFAGAVTTMLHPAFTDPLGLDFVLFDFINTNRFVPDPPMAGNPTFANTSITFFGELPGNPVSPAQIQFFFSEEPLGALDPGTHEIMIDLTAGGLNVDTGDIKGYDDYRGDGFIPGSFQIYINKSLSVTNPAFAWTVYIDNIRAGRAVPGDYNENGSVDAADYVVWRDNDGTSNPLPNDNGLGVPIGQMHYDLWRANFGGPFSGSGGSFGAVPEPASAALLLVGAACWWAGKRGGAAR